MTQFGTLTKEGKLVNPIEIDLSKVKSPDPLAYSYGFFQGSSGIAMATDKNLAKEYIRGFRDGRKKYKDDIKARNNMSFSDLIKLRKVE